MAPYAIAHLKIGLKLYETGYRFASDERARIYLTNALEPAHDNSDRFEFAIPALAHEAQAVNQIKQRQRFTVVIGNPPYSNFGQLNKIPFIHNLLEDYKRGLNEKKLNLDDDFIKFVRFAQYLLESSKAGVFGMITNNVFIDGITHRKMRESLHLSFRDISILDLHGSSKKLESSSSGTKEENVFDIQQGVGISIFVKDRRVTAHTVRHSDLWGSRASKYAALGQRHLDLARPHRHDIVAGGPPHDSRSAAGAFPVSKAVPPQRTPRKTSPEGWQAARMPRQTYS
jgi:predicted helicase